MQLATILYNDRINTYRRMKAIDELIEKEPTDALVAELAELRIRNLQAFRELETYNATKTFVGKHPLCTYRTEREELEDLFRDNASEFMLRYARAQSEVKRYIAFLQREDRSERRDRDQELLDKHRARVVLFQSIIENER